MRLDPFGLVSKAQGSRRPSRQALQAAMERFETSLDEEAEASLVPKDPGFDDQPELRTASYWKRVAREQQKGPARGFRWHDPKKRYPARAPPKSFATALDEAGDAALAASEALVRPPRRPGAARADGDDDSTAAGRPGGNSVSDPRSAPERAADWLVRKYDESALAED